AFGHHVHHGVGLRRIGGPVKAGGGDATAVAEPALHEVGCFGLLGIGERLVFDQQRTIDTNGLGDAVDGAALADDVGAAVVAVDAHHLVARHVLPPQPQADG